MAATLVISCPECEKQLKAPAELQGKKIRCKGCGHTFVVKAPAPEKPAPPKPTTKKGPDGPVVVKARSPSGKQGNRDDVYSDSNPYGVTDTDLAPRCPFCAGELDSDDQRICLVCGYDLHKRMRITTKKTYDLTFWDWFLWLLPGILCVLFILTLIGVNVWYLLAIDGLVRDTDLEFLSHGSIKMWGWIGSAFFIFFAGRFAVLRLIFHPRPPEKEKR